MMTYMPRLMFWRMFGGRMGLMLLGVLLVVGIVLLIVVLASRRNKTPAPKAAPVSGAAPRSGRRARRGRPAHAHSGRPPRCERGKTSQRRRL